MTRAQEDVLALVVCWSSNGDHLGEALCPTIGAGPSLTFGSGERVGTHARSVQLTRRRPGSVEARAYQSPRVGAAELELTALPGGIDVRRIGKCRLLANDGSHVERALVRPNETIELEDELVFVCARRPFELFGAAPDPLLHPFGTADAHGIVGESPAAWRLRECIRFMAERNGHLLLFGETGTGKELVAQAIHTRSCRGRRPLVARNAAVFPPGLVDAELFGNVSNYPNAGSPDRPGLIGQAHGSSLFLDEVGELPHELQAHLLRVLDAEGEYQRLGESRSRNADVRIIGATARSPDDLRLDFGARFRLRLELPGLGDRREDIPLIARHLLEQAAKSDPLAQRLFQTQGPSFGVTPALTRFLVTHPYKAHVRELDALLWRAIGSSNGCLDLPRAARLTTPADSAPTPKALSRDLPTPSEIRACLERHGGVQERAWRDLGLTSRYALKRLIRKYDLRLP